MPAPLCDAYFRRWVVIAPFLHHVYTLWPTHDRGPHSKNSHHALDNSGPIFPYRGVSLAPKAGRRTIGNSCIGHLFPGWVRPRRWPWLLGTVNFATFAGRQEQTRRVETLASTELRFSRVRTPLPGAAVTPVPLSPNLVDPNFFSCFFIFHAAGKGFSRRIAFLAPCVLLSWSLQNTRTTVRFRHRNHWTSLQWAPA